MTRDIRKNDIRVVRELQGIVNAFDLMFEPAGARHGEPLHTLVQAAIYAFHNRFRTSDTKEVELVATLLLEEAERNPPAHVFAQVLTGLALANVPENQFYYVDAAGERRQAITERSVHPVGRLIGPLFGSEAGVKMLVQWCVAMDQGITYPYRKDPVLGRQVTAVIRGALFSPALAQVDMSAFWTSAVSEPGFPMRVFSEPCRMSRGVIFSETHIGVIGRVLSGASEPAARSIASHIARQAKMKRVMEPGGSTMHEIVVAASQGERDTILRQIIDAVAGTERRALVVEEFAAGLAESAAKSME